MPELIKINFVVITSHAVNLDWNCAESWKSTFASCSYLLI